jgi:hypothetical protein
MKLSINAVIGHQFMLPIVSDNAITDDDNLAGIADGSEPMCNRNHV